jgi:hypothetical protein
MAQRKKDQGGGTAVRDPADVAVEKLDPGTADPDHGTHTRKSDRPEFGDSERLADKGRSSEAELVDDTETMASDGNSSSQFFEVASGTATGYGVDRGMSTGTGGLAAGEDLDPVAEGDYWREHFREQPYVKADKGYQDYEPGFRLGWEAATDLQFDGREFEEVETHLERALEARLARDPASWDELRPAARDAFQRARELSHRR